MGILTGSWGTNVYKIEAFLNDSFEQTLKELTESVLSEFDVDSISYRKSSFGPDDVKLGDINPYNMSVKYHKPEYIYATFNLCSEKGWTNHGGHEFCRCILKDKSKILVNWDTSSDSKKFEKLDIKFLRKIKLKKIEQI